MAATKHGGNVTTYEDSICVPVEDAAPSWSVGS